MLKKYKYAIIGGGFGGLTSGLRLRDFVIFEATDKLGGCGGYFIRNGKIFNVGATTIAFMGKNEYSKKFFESVGLKLDFLEHNKAFDIIENGKIYNKISELKSKGIFNKLYENFFSIIKYLGHFFNLVNDKEFDDILLISLQRKTPVFRIFYELSIDYYKSVWAIFKNGYYDLISQIEKKLMENGEVLKNTKVLKVIENKIITNNGEYYADKIIFNLDPWQVNRILDKEIMKVPNEELFNAIVIYLEIEEAEKLSNFYFLIKDNFRTIHSPFISIFQNGTITISGHYKKFYEDKEIDKILEIVKDVLKIKFKLVSIADKSAFEKYTSRYKGYVGGLPISYKNLIFSLYNGRKRGNYYFVGDYYFPLQSLPSSIIRSSFFLK
ncbi:MAG: NAD(P)-binding protein [candidate division WOR-3 bacterium]|nr:NAD(P)-binding protein [candidate division WOR-3 bacterium]MCX7947341.1 NAD(P)-binding protein [candidate division WOR-3 bacterium]MDW8150103.1 NAD(P)-binding protein [candidate division WOR-3 bacterium]